jgi:hypothetical protein
MEVGGEEFAVGVVISAKTTLGEEFEGQIVSFDRPSNLLVIHILPKSPSHLVLASASSSSASWFALFP